MLQVGTEGGGGEGRGSEDWERVEAEVGRHLVQLEML
jgi:hypothetical protein